MNKIKDTKSILMQAAHQMDIISKKYCPLTGCNQNRMKGVDNNDNCEWYHGAWMYCRLSGIVVSEDYLGVNYQSFFQKHSEKQCSILNITVIKDTGKCTFSAGFHLNQEEL